MSTLREISMEIELRSEDGSIYRIRFATLIEDAEQAAEVGAWFGSICTPLAEGFDRGKNAA